jgi:hypothetical protein
MPVKNVTKKLKLRIKNRPMQSRATTMETFLHRIGNVENTLIEVKTDMVWTKRIIIGAAGLGFLEKFIGWIH